MKPEDLLAKLKQVAERAPCQHESESDEPMTELQKEAHVARIRELAALFHVKHQFKAGDLAVRKPGLCDSRVGYKGRPVIVLEILDTPIRVPITPESVTSHRTAAVHDIIVMDIFDGDAVHFLEDSRRFQPYEA